MMNQDHHFEDWSKTYERDRMQWLLFDRVHRAVLNAIPDDLQPEVVLDIGCGTGRLLRKVEKRWPGARLIGVDLTEGMIDQARLAMPEGEFSMGPAERLPLPDASVDLALSTVSFHHWQDQSQGICEVARVLRPGGRFYLADTIPPHWITMVYHHGTIVPLKRLNLMFKQADLSLLAQKRILNWFFYLSVCEKDH